MFEQERLVAFQSISEELSKRDDEQSSIHRK
jgi:hypothetical protein